MRILHLYRPRVPELRAQSIQVLHTCAALARRGHRVTVLADRSAGFRGDVAEALAPCGLAPHPDLDLRLAPVHHGGAAGLWFRGAVAGWILGARGDGAWCYARDKRKADEFRCLGAWQRVGLVLEVHEVEAAQARERGDGDAARSWQAREGRVLRACRGVVSNCEGTMEVLAVTFPSDLPVARRVIHNATDPARAATGRAPGRGVAGYVGSFRAYKDVHLLVEAARLLAPGLSVRLLGGDPQAGDFAALRARAGDRVEILPGVPYLDVPGVLAALDVLILALGDDLYGSRLASPLKLWDYLAAGRPIVAPDLPSIRAICGDAFFPWRPGDAASLARAVEAAMAAGPVARRVRTWDDRASEIEEFLSSLGADVHAP